MACHHRILLAGYMQLDKGASCEWQDWDDAILQVSSKFEIDVLASAQVKCSA